MPPSRTSRPRAIGCGHGWWVAQGPCAIYTRKSSEEGLEQAFNSLQAEREACAAYIASQRHRGWQLLPPAGPRRSTPAKNRIAVIEAGRIWQVAALGKLFADPARAVVGRLMGSPSMVQLRGRRVRDAVRIDGLDVDLATGALVDDANGGAELLVGIWPDEVELSLRATDGFCAGTVYASEFRGTERVVQIEAGGQSFRRVVELDFPARQGDAIFFRLPSERLFLFDAANGRRLRPRAMI